MKKKSIKNLSLNKKSISNLRANKETGGTKQNSIQICVLTLVDQNGNNICLSAAYNCHTVRVGCVKTNEVDPNTLPIC